MKIAIVDIETTDVKKNVGKIVEVGIVELNLDTGERKIVYDKICHERPITLSHVQNAWIIKNSTLTVEEIRASPQFKDLIPEIQAKLDEYELGATAFNNDFDFGWLEDRGINFRKKLPCGMKLSTNVLQLPPTQRMVLAGRNHYKNPNVQEAYNFFFPGNTYIEQHRGADDAFHEAEIFWELYKLGVFKID